jgi:hypothetical protein
MKKLIALFAFFVLMTAASFAATTESNKVNFIVKCPATSIANKTDITISNAFTAPTTAQQDLGNVGFTVSNWGDHGIFDLQTDGGKWVKIAGVTVTPTTTAPTGVTITPGSILNDYTSTATATMGTDNYWHFASTACNTFADFKFNIKLDLTAPAVAGGYEIDYLVTLTEH